MNKDNRFWQQLPIKEGTHYMDYGYMGYDPVTDDETDQTSNVDEVKFKDVEFDFMSDGISYKVKGITLASCTAHDEVNQ